MTHLIELGSGGAWPDARRNPPGHALLTSRNDLIVVDCGAGASQQLARAGYATRDISALVLTHTHIDHCLDLASLAFTAFLTGRTLPLRIFGPPGIDQMINGLFQHTFPFANEMLTNLRDQPLLLDTVEIEVGSPTPLTDSTQITAYEMKHGITTFGYRMEVDNSIVAISGDTAPCDNLNELAEGADLLVQDCSWPDDDGPRPGHCIPSQIAELCRLSRPRAVLLHHMFPPCEGRESDMVRSASRGHDAAVTMAADLMTLRI